MSKTVLKSNLKSSSKTELKVDPDDSDGIRLDFRDSLTISLDTPRGNINTEDKALMVDIPTVLDESDLIKNYDDDNRKRAFCFSYFMLGLSSFFPWVLLSTAADFYYEYKFKRVQPAILSNGTASLLNRLDDYNIFFICYLGLFFKIPNLAMKVISLFVPLDHMHVLVLIGGALMVIFQLSQLSLALIDSRSWPELCFWLTMACCPCIDMAGAFLSVFAWGGMVLFPGMEVVVHLGHCVGGIVGALLGIFVKLGVMGKDLHVEEEHFEDRLMAIYQRIGLYYFLIGLTLCCITWVAYGSLLVCNFHYRVFIKEIRRNAIIVLAAMKKSIKAQLGVIVKGTAHRQSLIAFLYLVTTCCFPCIQILIAHEHSFPAPIIYREIVVYLICYFGFLVGNLMTLKTDCPGPSLVCYMVLLRIVLIPLLLLCNYLPHVRKVHKGLG